jgi:hypothetical protein
VSDDGSVTLGHYRVAFSTPAAAFAANAVLATLRWTSATAFCVPLRLQATLAVATAVTAQRLDPIVATVARAYTVADNTNTTTVTLSGNNAKMRTNMGTAASVLLVTSAAAGISGGTRTLDANPVGIASLSTYGAIGGLGTGIPMSDLYGVGADEYPLVLTQNEGLVISWGATALATGTAIVGFQFEWAECPTF